jgi:hypothetical protein
LVTGRSCFLDSPEWLSVFEEDCEHVEKWDELQANLIPIYATLPALMRDINSQAGSTTKVNDLLGRAWTFRRQLLGLEPMANQILCDPASVNETQTTHSDSPFKICYHFSSALVAQPLLLYWRLIIIINSMIHNLLARTEVHCIDVKELKVSSIHAADQIAMSAQDGRQSMPIVSVHYFFSLPAAIWAYSNHEFREWKSPSEPDWLLELLCEYLRPMNKLVRAIMVKYWDAVGMPCSNIAIFAGLNSDDWAKCETKWTAHLSQMPAASPSVTS